MAYSANSMNSFAGRTVAVLGLGKSGRAATRLLLAEGADVIVLESGGSDSLERSADELRASGAQVMLRCNEFPAGQIDCAVVSPGIPPQAPLRIEACSRGIKLMSEIELGWSRLRTPTIAVTGSNGKSSVVKWISETLREAGLKAAVGGNYGMPASALALERVRPDWLVLEVSSFQLETVRCFRAEIAVLLNVLPNHLDRHLDMQAYRFLKERIFAFSASSDHCILPSDLAGSVKLPAVRPLWTTFAYDRDADWCYRDGSVFWAQASEQRWHRGDLEPPSPTYGRSIDMKDTYFANEVLGAAAAAVMAVCDAAGISQRKAVDALRNFEPLPHRMQFVDEVGGVRFVDDSKATNIAAMLAALRMSTGPVRLIAGGRAKESEFEGVADALAHTAVKVYLIGEAAENIGGSLGGRVACEHCETLDRALSSAWRDANPGDVVLLSPGCASFDQFENFEDRGNYFIKCVKDLAKRGEL